MNFDNFHISDYISLSSFNVILLTIVFITILSITIYTYFYFFYPVIKNRIDKKIKEYKKKQSSFNLKKWRKKILYLWADSTKLLKWNLYFLAAFIVSVFLYIVTGIWFYILILLLYLIFLKIFFETYNEFPELVSKALQEHEKAIEENVLKEIEIHYDSINEELNNLQKQENFKFKFDDTQIVKFPIEEKKANFPPFAKWGGVKQTVVLERRLQFLVFKRDFFSTALNPTKFNFLKPEKNKKKELVRAAGPTKDYFYSKIKKIEYKDEILTIQFQNGNEELEDFKLKCKAPISKQIIKNIRDRRRVLERIYLDRIGEFQKFSMLKKNMDVFIEEKKEEKGDNNSKEK